MTAAADRPTFLSLHAVTKRYVSKGNASTALNGVDLVAHPGELVLLLGPSGSGKTTLLTIAAGFIQPSAGTVNLFGRRIEEYSVKELQILHSGYIGFIFQTFLLIESLSAVQNVALQLRFAGASVTDARSRSLQALDRVGIAHLASRRPGELSHGERQRVAVARAVASGARLLIADEPTASLDAEQGEHIIRLLHECATELGACVLVASHDTRLCGYAHSVHMLENGTIKRGVA